MNLADVDRMAGYSEGFGPIAQGLQWLDTLLRSPSVAWAPGQHEAAARVLKDARRVLYSDLLDAARAAMESNPRPPMVEGDGLYGPDGLLLNVSLVPNLLGLRSREEFEGYTVRRVRIHAGEVVRPEQRLHLITEEGGERVDLSRALDERRGSR